MTRNLWIGVATVVVGCVAGYAFHMLSDTTATRIALYPAIVAKYAGDAETSDAIEPLIVEGGGATIALRMPVGDEVPIPRVVMTTGMQQPPRPDAEPGTVLRMPYADEDEDWLGVTVDRVLRILETNQPHVNLFDPAEESENRDVTPEPEPELPPMPTPIPDYHQGHCPYQGPYRR